MNNTQFPELPAGSLACYITANTLYRVIDANDIKKSYGLCSISHDGRTLYLPPNPSNRKQINLVKVQTDIRAHGYCPLTYKPTRHVTPVADRIPHSKLVSHLPEPDYTTYLELIGRARTAMLDNKLPCTTRPFKGPRNLVDYISDEDYPTYLALLDKAEAAYVHYKANTPRAKSRQTREERLARQQARLDALQKQLDALLLDNNI